MNRDRLGTMILLRAAIGAAALLCFASTPVDASPPLRLVPRDCVTDRVANVPPVRATSPGWVGAVENMQLVIAPSENGTPPSNPVEFTIEGNGEYCSRRIVLFHDGRGWQKGELYLFPTNDARAMEQRLAQAIHWLDSGQYDRALASTENAFNELSNEDNLLAIVKCSVYYNFGRALQQSTINLDYAFADKAREIFTACKIFAKPSTQTLIERALSDIDRFQESQREREVLSHYDPDIIDRAWEKDAAALKRGAEALDTIIETYDTNAAVWERNGKPKKNLLKDSGLLWLAYGEKLLQNFQAEQEDDPNACLDTAMDRLNKAKQLGMSSDELTQAIRRGSALIRQVHKNPPDSS